MIGPQGSVLAMFSTSIVLVYTVGVLKLPSSLKHVT